MGIEDHYRRLTDETRVPCPSVTFWRTVDGNWGARAGLGERVFAMTLDAAIREAVNEGIYEKQRRDREKSALTTPQ